MAGPSGREARQVGRDEPTQPTTGKPGEGLSRALRVSVAVVFGLVGIGSDPVSRWLYPVCDLRPLPVEWDDKAGQWVPWNVGDKG